MASGKHRATHGLQVGRFCRKLSDGYEVGGNKNDGDGVKTGLVDKPRG